MVAPSPPNQKQDLADWFYLPTWKRRPLPPAAVKPETTLETLLVFVDNFDVAPHLIHKLERAGHTLIQVKIGETFVQEDATHYCLNPRQPQDYDSLLQSLGKVPNTVVHLWTLPAFEACPSTEQLEQYQAQGFYSLLFFAQAWNKQGLTHPCDLVVITQQLHNVTGEDSLAPAKATLLGPIQTIPKESPGLTCRCVDIVLTDLNQRLADQLVAELETTVSETAVAYRANRRWVQDFEPYPIDAVHPETSKFHSSGVYLITGGLGGLGLSIAQHLAQKYQPTLILLGRSPLPPVNAWDDLLKSHDSDDSVVNKIKAIRALEAEGAAVHIATADVCNRTELDTALSAAIDQTGSINGVIHSAGVLGGGLVTLMTQEEAETVMAPKVQGTFNLEKALENQSLDFVVLCSSLTAVVGAVGQTSYCAANAFLDAYANSRSQDNGTHYLTVNWDSVQQVGMAIDGLSQLIQRLANEHAGESLLRQIEMDLAQGILPQETGEVLERLLIQTEPWALVSTRPLHQRLAELAKHYALTNPDASLAPALDLPYAPGESIPDDQVEAVVMKIFQTLLGVNDLGINDNFFEVGGDSLIGTQLLFHLRQTFAVDIPIATVFDTPTIGKLVEVIKEKQQATSTTDELDKLSDLLDQMEELSDGEASILLND